MRRIFGEYAYGDGPRAGCWWDETCDLPVLPELEGARRVDVAIIGGGFTGLSAALRLARKGTSVVVLDANGFGWGASGRNGGFCCLGGSKASDASLDSRFGRAARLAYRRAEKDAVDLVDQLISQYGWHVDRHSEGETQLAHRPQTMAALEHEAVAAAENYGVEPTIIRRDELHANGFGGGPFFGALTVPLGFGLNPRKYLRGLMQAAQAEGAELLPNSPVEAWDRSSAVHRLKTPRGSVRADQVIVATNGYSSEDLPDWLAGRYMPAQSTVLVTRPLTQDERGAQGWTSTQMSYDTRNLLHYFRLMPDGRFLFGMRGGLLSGPAAEASARAKTRKDFERMFPAWKHVESVNTWSGMVCLARGRVPYVGSVPGLKGAWAAMCYHGNGVAMGSYAGRMVADLVLGKQSIACPEIMQCPLEPFPFGRFRRLSMPFLYSALRLWDGR